MRRFTLHQGAVTLLLAACLAGPAAAAWPAANHTPAVPGHGTLWAHALEHLGRVFSHLFAPEGSSIDPDGKPHQAPGGTTPLPPGISAPTSVATPIATH